MKKEKSKHKSKESISNGKKAKRISAQIVAKSLTTVGCVFIVVAVVTVAMVLSLTMSSKETELTLESQAASYQLEDFFNQYTRSTDQMAVNPQIKQLLGATGKSEVITEKGEYATVFENLVNIAETDSNILASWVGDIDASVLTQSDGYTSPADWDITERPWYACTQTGEHLLTEPYIDASTGELILSAASPVYNKNEEAIGVAGLDISMKQITALFEQHKIGEEGFLMLFSADGTMIYHPDEKQIQKNVKELGFSDNLTEAVESGKTKFLKYSTSDGKKYGYVTAVGNTGFLVVSSLPVSEYFSSLIMTVIMLIIIFAAGILVVVIAMKKVAAGIAKPIMELNETAQKLAEGDLDVTIEIASEDEIGELGQSISATVNRLKEYINYIDEIAEVLGEIADGKLSVQLQYDYVGEFQKVKAALLHISSSMKEVMEGINESATQVSAGADDLANAAQGLAEGSEVQAAAVEELLATSTTVAEQVEENKSEAELSAGKTQEVTDMMVVSGKRMDEMFKAMTKIQETSKQVVGIIQTIEEIASQTNLLSLNASIEAARAGEAGRGFAVVASEIGGLADESARAVNTTRDLIGISLSEIERGTQLAKEVEESIRTSVDAVGQVNEMIKKTAENAVNQAENMEQIRKGVEDMSISIQDSSAMAEESSATSEELAAQAVTLNELVQRFELE